ncbi:MAG: phage head closure protein [Pseudomonadota bacterium]
MIGPLRERVTLLSPVRVPDGGGGFDVQYTVKSRVKARTVTQGSTLDNIAGRNARGQIRQFTLRYRSDLLYEMRLEHAGKRYRITNITEEDDRKRYHFVIGEEIRP